ncbi:MAG: histidine--tRNA ligase family protein [Chloroflexi bacterium]|nr:histidine--tRNA ligase family protein [Chloroflexota bacterium]
MRALTRVGNALERFLGLYGYQPIDTPVLEETDLFLRKSGGELASKMYTFTDPGGRLVSLRPEFTASATRMYVQAMKSLPVPVRWRYAGPVFRHETDGDADHRQFTQVGAEMFGASGTWADAEVLAIAWKGLAQLGLRRHRLVIGHVAFITSLLEALGLSDRARVLLLGSVGTLSRGGDGVAEVSQKAASLGLLGDGAEARSSVATVAEEALALLERSLEGGAGITFGVRSPEEVRERFRRKHQQAQGAGRVEEALKLLGRVVRVKGAPEQALREVRTIVDAGPAREELEELSRVVEALAAYGVIGPVTLDFGLARGIAYYNGIVFDIQHSAAPGASLGGGGRYDGLVQALGQAQVGGQRTALGFAWAVERVAAALAAEHHDAPASEQERAPVLVRAESRSAMPRAAHEAERLRGEGTPVELDVSGRSTAECITYARKRGFRQVLTVDAQGGVKRANVSERARGAQARHP